MAKVGERNKVMKILDRKGYDSNIIEDVAPYTVEIGKYQIVICDIKLQILRKRMKD
jgi:hypothetical protein